MSFDDKTNTISINADGDFLADSGSFFLKVFRDVGAGPNAPKELAADWAVIAAWLGCEGRELTQDDYQKFGVVFRSYLAQGNAPSTGLQESFNLFAKTSKTEAWRVVPVPPALVPVFRRMLVNDRSIQEKRASDARQFGNALRAPSSLPTRPADHAQRTGEAYAIIQLSWVPLAASTVMLLMASSDRWPYGFYQLLRIVVTATAVYFVTQTINRRQLWPWIMGGVAILFNPIVPISFSREEWQPIDLGIAVIFVVALVQSLRRRL